DLESTNTRPEFQAYCLAYQAYWRQRCRPRHAIGLNITGADQLAIMLMQRHINLVDDRNNIYIDDEKVAKTLRSYAEMVAGPRKIAAEFNSAPGQAERDVSEGQICARVTPDWAVGYLKIYGPGAAGKMRMMPLPRFDPDDAQTASWGGTMIGIPRKAKNPDLSWKLIEALYLDHDAIAFRRRVNAILPPITTYW